MAGSANSMWVRKNKGVQFTDTTTNAAAFTSTANYVARPTAMSIAARAAFTEQQPSTISFDGGVTDVKTAPAGSGSGGAAGLTTPTPSGGGTASLAADVATGHSGLRVRSAKEMAERRRSKAPVKNKNAVVGILNGMKQQPRFGKMLEYSLECLKKFAVDEPSVEEMIECGAIETMLAIMKLNEKNEKLMQLVRSATSPPHPIHSALPAHKSHS